jgi:hypothetical protein
MQRSATYAFAYLKKNVGWSPTVEGLRLPRLLAPSAHLYRCRLIEGGVAENRYDEVEDHLTLQAASGQRG